MRLAPSAKFAARSLGRNARRSALSVAGIGVGCAIALVTTSFVRGERTIYVRAAAESGAGHLRIAPARWAELRDDALRLADWKAAREAARSMPGVIAAAPRARAEALLAMGTHVSAVEIAGVDPAVEPRALRFVRTIAQGRYLAPGDTGKMVLGRAIATDLGSDVGDELVVTLVRPDGGMQSELFTIVGIADTGVRSVDEGICQVTLGDVERLSGLRGAGEIAVILRDADRLEATRAALASRLPPGDVVLAWYDVSPSLRAGIEIDRGQARLMVGIVVVVVLLGVASAQLGAILERRREFAVLVALGMPGAQAAWLVVTEAVALGIAGGLVGLAVGAPVVLWLATRGLDLRLFMESKISVAGVLLEPVMYGDLGWWIVGECFGLALLAALIASAYPAWFAARTDPATALRVAR